MISLATSLNLLLKGRVTGMSGVVNNIVTFDGKSISRSICLVSGILVASSILFKTIGFSEFIGKARIFDPPYLMTLGMNRYEFAVAGLLVGFGTKLSNGCTSGHGVCGLPRFSLRSFVAVCCFLVTGIVVATLRYHGPIMGATQVTEEVI